MIPSRHRAHFASAYADVNAWRCQYCAHFFIHLCAIFLISLLSLLFIIVICWPIWWLQNNIYVYNNIVWRISPLLFMAQSIWVFIRFITRAFPSLVGNCFRYYEKSYADTCAFAFAIIFVLELESTWYYYFLLLLVGAGATLRPMYAHKAWFRGMCEHFCVSKINFCESMLRKLSPPFGRHQNHSMAICVWCTDWLMSCYVHKSSFEFIFSIRMNWIHNGSNNHCYGSSPKTKKKIFSRGNSDLR